MKENTISLGDIPGQWEGPVAALPLLLQLLHGESVGFLPRERHSGQS